MRRVGRVVVIASVVLVGVLTFITAGLASSAAQQTPSPAPAVPQPVGTMSELMINIIYPTSDAILYVSGRTPTNDVQWNALRNQALMLAESGNLLMMPGRARAEEKWMADAKQLREVGIKAFEAAKRRDLAALEDLNEPLYEVCVSCHVQYRPNYRRR